MTPLLRRQLRRRLLLAGAALGGALLVYLLGPVLTPFFGAALLAYIADPLVGRLQRLLPRTWATALVFLVLSLLALVALLFAIPALQRQMVGLFGQLPLHRRRSQRTPSP